MLFRSAVLHDLPAVHENMRYADGVGVDAAFIPRDVTPDIRSPSPDRFLVKDDDVGVKSRFDPTALDQPEVAGDAIGHTMDRLLQRNDPEVAHTALEDHARKGEGVDQVEMRASVGGADQRPVILPQLPAQPISLRALDRKSTRLNSSHT